VIQLVANTRRLVAVMAAFALLAGLVPVGARAQGDPKPAEPAAAADSTAIPTPPVPTPAPAAPSGKQGKKAKAPKLTKEQKAAAALAEKEARAKASAEKAAARKAKQDARVGAKAGKAAATSPATSADTSPDTSAAAPTTKVEKPAKPGKHAEARKPKAQKQASAEKPAKKARPAKAPKAPPVARAPEKSWEEQRKEDGIYAKRSNWISFRFGYAKRTGDVAGDGFVGYGVGYQRMLTRRYAFAATAGHDIVAHFQSQLDEAVPLTGEFQRHFKWSTALRPYVGLGGGYYLRKKYRTAGEYNTTTTGGGHVSLGFTSALDVNHVIGFETRVAWLQGRPGVVNPTFGPGEDTETLWTAKVIWGLVY
jgi:hypothetical protein